MVPEWKCSRPVGKCQRDNSGDDLKHLNRRGNPQVSSGSRMKSGRWWGERMSTNICRKPRELGNHHFGIPEK